MDLNLILKEIRLSKRLTIQELSDFISIDPEKIKAAESSSFYALLSKKELNIILKKYSKKFKLSFYKLKKLLRESSYSNIYKNNFLNKGVYNFSFTGFLKVFAVCVVVLALSFYIGFEIKNRYSAPELFVYNESDYNTNKNEIIIFGKTIKNALLDINGENVMINKDGSFSKEIILNEGVNIIQITSAKNGGRKTTITKRIIFED